MNHEPPGRDDAHWPNATGSACAAPQSARFEIPIPVPIRPVPPVNPHHTREAFVGVLAILYHAERAAMEAFGRLGDPNVVEKCEIFISVQPLLMADEERHVRDMEALIATLGVSGIPPAPKGFYDLWDVEQSRRKLLFPMRARVAALFTFLAESLGYACLYQLAHATETADEQFASLLRANVEDEKRHIQVSVDVLRSALADSNGLASLDLALHLCAFLLMSREAARTMLSNLAQAGFDPYVMAGSSVRFTYSLLQDVVEQGCGPTTGSRLLGLLTRMAASPSLVRIFAAAARLPELPLFWPALRAASRMIRRLDSPSAVA
jgi:hypothetical protein